MYEGTRASDSPAGVESPAVLSTAELSGLVERLCHLDADVDDAERIDQIRALEMIKSACAAAQARVTVGFAESQRAAQRAAGVKASDLGRGIGSQVALARRDSASRGGRHLGLAEALVHEMPHTLAALEAGLTSEWRATIVVRETACLSAEHRGLVDEELAERLPRLGDLRVERQARAAAYRLDPQAFMRRIRGAVADRRVTCRPAPDTMARLSGFLPAALGVAAYAALARTADELRADGDERSRGQIMADLFYARLTGQDESAHDDAGRHDEAADDDTTPGEGEPDKSAPEDAEAGDAGRGSGLGDVPVGVNLVLTDKTLFGHDDEPAQLEGYGPIPAALARRIVRDTRCRVWLRRLYTRPGDGALVAMDSRARLFPDGLRRVLIVRDQTCRTPWCDAPIRHGDHVRSVADGGETSAANGQGLCEACNYAKAMPGWTARPVDDAAGGIETITPTGHTYTSHPPPLPGTPRWRNRPPDLIFGSELERRLRLLLFDAA